MRSGNNCHLRLYQSMDPSDSRFIIGESATVFLDRDSGEKFLALLVDETGGEVGGDRFLLSNAYSIPEVREKFEAGEISVFDFFKCGSKSFIVDIYDNDRQTISALDSVDHIPSDYLDRSASNVWIFRSV